jgi:carbonic anhydrase/acetyltransferase-like protein (isoleucine patch superfamily)
MKFIHEKANIEGDVELGENASVWPFASIRGDEGKIIIGDNTNIQDNAVIHGKTAIGKNTTIGHGAIIHQAEIGNNVIIGINATVLDNAKIGDWCIIAAASLVPSGTKINPGSMVIGVPGKITRKLEEKDKKYIVAACRNYLNKIK